MLCVPSWVLRSTAAYSPRSLVASRPTWRDSHSLIQGIWSKRIGRNWWRSCPVLLAGYALVTVFVNVHFIWHVMMIIVIMEIYNAPKLSKYMTTLGAYNVKSFTYEINQHMHEHKHTHTHTPHHTHTHVHMHAHTHTHTST